MKRPKRTRREQLLEMSGRRRAFLLGAARKGKEAVLCEYQSNKKYAEFVN